jgi:alanine-glyoxylate transaminase/serine-glyoxylate transaminase/serine-pyruvate transaminase
MSQGNPYRRWNWYAGYGHNVANLIERGDNVLVISSGYFGKLQRYFRSLRGKYNTLEAPLGEIVPIEVIENELKNRRYKALLRM